MSVRRRRNSRVGILRRFSLSPYVSFPNPGMRLVKHDSEFAHSDTYRMWDDIAAAAAAVTSCKAASISLCSIIRLDCEHIGISSCLCVSTSTGRSPLYTVSALLLERCALNWKNCIWMERLKMQDLENDANKPFQISGWTLKILGAESLTELGWCPAKMDAKMIVLTRQRMLASKTDIFVCECREPHSARTGTVFATFGCSRSS